MSDPPWVEYQRPARPAPRQTSSEGAFAGATGTTGTRGASGARGVSGTTPTRRPRLEAAVPFVPAAAFVADPRRAVRDTTGFMANVNRGLGIGDEIAAGMGAGVNALQGRGGGFNGALADQRAYEQQVDPNTAALGRGTGMAGTALVPLGGAAAQGGSLAGNALRGAVTGGTTAAIYSAADAGTPQERLSNAAAAARDPIVLGLGAAGGALLSPRTPRPTPQVDPNIRELRQRGVRLTPGQVRGGAARANEDAAMSTPIVGDAIRARRTEGIEDFNRGVLNDAHQAAFGTPAPANVRAGRAGVRQVGDAISAGYRRTVPTGGVTADGEFANAVRAMQPDIDILTPAARAQLSTILEQRVTSRFRNMGNPSGRPLLTNGASGSGPRMDGRTYQRVQSELGDIIKRYSRSTDADQRGIGEVLQGVSDGLEAAARRQNPRFAEQMDRLDAGWALVTRAEDAASGAGAVEGVFTPSQYGAAVRRGDPRVRHRGYARGEARGQRYADAGRAVLPSTIPDSGTARRSMVGQVLSGGRMLGGAITGGLAGGASGNPGAGALIGGVAAPVAEAVVQKLASLRYSPQVIARFNTALDSRIAAADRQAAMGQLQQLARRDPQIQALLEQVQRQVAIGTSPATRRQLEPQ